MYTILPLSSAARQVFTIDLAPDGIPLHARIELRYLPAPDQWVFSLWDHSTEELLVNMIPLVCSYGQINDLFIPFRHLRNGQGIGSLFVLKDTDEPETTDPAGETLQQFQILIGDTYG